MQRASQRCSLCCTGIRLLLCQEIISLLPVGPFVGECVGRLVGEAEGLRVGEADGEFVGLLVCSITSQEDFEC